MSLSSQYKELKKLVPKKGELVLGYGDPGARIMVIGEAPGREEVLAGRPFVGKAGRNLDEFLKEAGISRSALYLTNVVKFRPVRIGKKGTTANNKGRSSCCGLFIVNSISPDLGLFREKLHGKSIFLLAYRIKEPSARLCRLFPLLMGPSS